MTYIVYGIPNCDTVRKARKWLNDKNISYKFHDIRKAGLSPSQVENWFRQLSQEQVLNKRSSSWKSASAQLSTAPSTHELAVLISNEPTLLKRPLLATATDTALACGFKEQEWQALIQV